LKIVYLSLWHTFPTLVWEAGMQGVQGHPQNFWIDENTGKICRNLGKMCENLCKIDACALMYKNDTPFLELNFLWSFFRGYLGKNPSLLQKFACSYMFAYSYVSRWIGNPGIKDAYTTTTAYCSSKLLLWRMCTWCWRESNAKEELGRQNVAKGKLSVIYTFW